MEMKIDYSRIPETQVEQKSSYRPPRHVYFGKRDPETGMMEEEPTYVHQDYPRMIYKMEGGGIVADIVNDDESLNDRLKDGWVKNPSELGYLTAPSFEQVLAMKAGKSPVAETKASKKTSDNTGNAAYEPAAFTAPKK